MRKSNFTNNVTRNFYRAGLKLRKHGPELFVIAGVVGAVVSAVMACKATRKLDPILEEAKEKIDTIHECVEKGETVVEVDGEATVAPYTEKDGNKDITLAYGSTAISLIKLYAPSVILGTLSITAILTSNHILRKRNIELAAAYAGLSRSFKEYRGRVVERFGEALDKELRYNIKAKEVTETVVKDDGTEETATKTVNVPDPNAYSDYARIYDSACIGWEKDPEMNLMFLRRQQEYANQRLKTRGHLFLNEVYDMLGFPPTKAGNIVGWIYDEKHPVGDNFVDFGIYNIDSERNRAFVNGYERNILLDFNVDGNILDLI